MGFEIALAIVGGLIIIVSIYALIVSIWLSVSLTGTKPVWFKIENRLPYCVKKACRFFNRLHFFALLSNLFSYLKLYTSPNE